MEPKMVTRDQFMIVGMDYVGNNQGGEFSKLWEKFLPRLGEIKNIDVQGAFYGVCECKCEGECKCGSGGDMHYMAGAEVSSTDDIPEGMVSKTIPAAKYAVFTHLGSLEGLHKTFELIYSQWLPAAGLTPGANFCFELYDERFKNFAEDSELDIYVPVG